jgi:hypothetical protein
VNDIEARRKELQMETGLTRVVVLLGVVLLTGACATSQEWSDWRQNKAHFASSQHVLFSLRNSTSSDVRVTRADVEATRTEGWWGTPVTVSSDEIIQK